MPSISLITIVFIHFCMMQHFDETFYTHDYNLILQSFNFITDTNTYKLVKAKDVNTWKKSVS